MAPSTNLDRPLKNILVLGATGNIGRPIIQALASHPSATYNITAVTRDASTVPPSTFPPGVKLISSDLTLDSLRPVFAASDAVISCVMIPRLAYQKSLIDLAISCNVARFIPSEFGVNTTHPDAPSIMPLVQPKIDVQTYLQQKASEGKIGYTTIFNGSFFDWFFRFPSGMGWDVEDARAVVYDGGEVPYEVTTVEKIAEAVANALAPGHAAETRDRRVFINSFTVTQNMVLAELEKAVGRKFEVSHDEREGLRARVLQRQDVDDGGERALAAELIEACLGGEGGLDLFSRDPNVGGLWNERLGLKEESLAEAVMSVIAGGKKPGMPGTKA